MMKKLLSLTAGILLISANANAITWGLIGDFNGWNDDVEMTEINDGVFSVTVESLQGEFKFRADHDWMLNYGADYIAQITGNATLPMAQDGMNFSFPQEVKDVTLTIDTNTSSLSISGLPNDMEVIPPVQPATLYLIGEPAGEWNPAVGISMNIVDEGIYTWEGNLYENQYFAFASELSPEEDWAFLNSHRYGPAQDGSDLIAGEVNAMTYPQEAAWRVAEEGNYKLTADINNLTLTAEKIIPEWGLIGDFNNWADDVMMEETVPGIYSVTMDSLAGQFKFRQNRDWSVNFGSNDWEYNVVKVPGEYALVQDGANFYIEETKDVTLTINVPERILTVSSLTGISGIASDSGEPQYFNLQGIRVSTPEKGIYIRVHNNKTEKVILH